MKKEHKILIGLITAILVCLFLYKKINTQTTPYIKPAQNEAPPVATKPKNTYTTITLDDLAKTVGPANVEAVLRINRVDATNLKKGMTLIVPSDYSINYNPFPETISAAATIPKLVLVSQKIQFFGMYEFGKLIRSGPVSSGKESTPTKSKLYFTNWKGERVISDVNDTWILKWDFNLDNFDGTSIHQYSLPGYPASHSCVRLFAADAKLNGWTLSVAANQHVLGWLILFPPREFEGSLVHLTDEELSTIVTKNLDTITAEANNRAAVLGH